MQKRMVNGNYVFMVSRGLGYRAWVEGLVFGECLGFPCPQCQPARPSACSCPREMPSPNVLLGCCYRTEFNLRYYSKEALVFTILPYFGNLIPKP